MIDTQGTLSGIGPNSGCGTTGGNAKDLGFGALTENSGSTDVAAPSGTTGDGFPSGVQNVADYSTDTKSMPVPEGTVDTANRWGI